jgi:hypothetical protein
VTVTVTVTVDAGRSRIPANAALGLVYSLYMKLILTGRMAQAAGKYGEHAPMVTVCCNACRTCVTTNIIGLLTAVFAGAASKVTGFARHLAKPSS